MLCVLTLCNFNIQSFALFNDVQCHLLNAYLYNSLCCLDLSIVDLYRAVFCQWDSKLLILHLTNACLAITLLYIWRFLLAILVQNVTKHEEVIQIMISLYSMYQLCTLPLRKPSSQVVIMCS